MLSKTLQNQLNPVDRWGNKIKHKSRRKWVVWTSLQASPLSDVFMKGNVFHEYQDQTASQEAKCLMVMFDCTVELVYGQPTEMWNTKHNSFWMVLLIDGDKKWSWRGSVHPGCFRHCDCTGLDWTCMIADSWFMYDLYVVTSGISECFPLSNSLRTMGWWVLAVFQ